MSQRFNSEGCAADFAFGGIQHRKWTPDKLKKGPDQLKTLDQLKKVMWSDESRFQLLIADGEVQVWCKLQEAVDSTYY